MSIRCFISHSWQNGEHEFATTLANVLQRRGINVWLDEARIPGGGQIKEQVMTGIHGSDVFLLVMSPASVNSPWCRAELDEALKLRSETGVQIIPILLKDCLRPETLTDILYIDFRNEKAFSDSLEQLVVSIEKLYYLRTAIKELLEGDEQTRFHAAQKLATLKNRFVVPILSHRLLVEPIESDPTVRYWLALALGQIDEEIAHIALQRAKERETNPWAKQGIIEGLRIFNKRITK